MSNDTIFKKGNYTQVPNAMLDDPRLKSDHKSILLTLHRHKPDRVLTHVKNMKAIGIGKDRYKTAREQLEEFGYLTFTEAKNKRGHQKGHTVKVKWAKGLASASKPIGGKRTVGNGIPIGGKQAIGIGPTSGKPTVGKPHLLNKTTEGKGAQPSNVTANDYEECDEVIELDEVAPSDAVPNLAENTKSQTPSSAPSLPTVREAEPDIARQAGMSVEAMSALLGRPEPLTGVEDYERVPDEAYEGEFNSHEDANEIYEWDPFEEDVA